MIAEFTHTAVTLTGLPVQLTEKTADHHIPVPSVAAIPAARTGDHNNKTNLVQKQKRNEK